MNARPVLQLTALLGVVFGVALTLAPEALSGIFGWKIDLQTSLVERILGGAWLGYAVLNWIASSGDARLQRATTYADLCQAVIGFPVAAWSATNGVGNQLMWFWVVLFGGFAIAYAYLLWGVRRREVAPSHA